MRREVILPELHDNQYKVITEAQRFNVLDCGRRWGKSVLATNLVSETAIEGWPAGYFAPTYKLLEATFKEVLICLEPVILRKHDNQFIELLTGGLIEFWSLDNPNAGRSRKYKRVVVDEAAFVKELWEAWTKAIRPTLTDLKGDAFFMSTPRGKNDFYKLYVRGASGEKSWKSWQMPTSTNPYIDLSELDDAKRDLPEAAYLQEYEALFSDNAANPFGSQFIKNAIRPLSKNPTACYGVDLAKSHDWTVVIGLDSNGQVSEFHRWQSDWGQTTRRIIDLVKQKPAYIDSTGVGNPIVEEITRSCSRAEGFVFTSTSKQQIMEGLANSIQKGEIYVLPEMVDELESFEFVYSKSGVKYSAPDGMHDDIVCALALANHRKGKRGIQITRVL
jgi:phage FluMu gp28-like protein